MKVFNLMFSTYKILFLKLHFIVGMQPITAFPCVEGCVTAVTRATIITNSRPFSGTHSGPATNKTTGALIVFMVTSQAVCAPH